ncbi:2-oxoglutarate and iron-dependent oxygenase domain-containing protein [Comamonadaceae bacterium PP-2]
MRYLPIVDLSDTFESEAGAARVARQIDAISRQHGFLYVVGHRVPEEWIATQFKASRRFFSLPETEKNRLHIERSTALRGYDPMGLQSLDPGKPADLKEGFNIGLEFDPVLHVESRRHSPNQWPDDDTLPGFKATSERYFHALDALGRHLMGLLAMALGLQRNHFDPSLTRCLSTLRLLHYPPQNVVEHPSQMGCGSHTDWGSLTLLAQDEIGGLEVLDEHGQWQPVPPVPGSFVVNLGDLVARWTNDIYRSTVHRLVNRVSGRDRYSLPYFFQINEDTSISPLPGCVSDDRPQRYPTVSAGEHLIQKYLQSRGLNK